MIVTLGRYFTRASSVNSVKVLSSTIACAFAWISSFGLRKSVTLCFLLLVILHILQLVVALVKYHFMMYTIFMITFILFLVVGAIMVYLAQNNLSLITLHLGPYSFSDIPLFYVIIGALIAGLIFAYIVFFINSIFTGFTMRGKDKTIKQGKSEVIDLTKQVHQLELENERLKNNSTVIEPQDINSL